MNTKNILLSVSVAMLGSFSMHAQTVTISGSDLSGLKFSGAPGDSQFVSGTPDYVALSTPDSGLTGDAPGVFVKAASAGVPTLGTLGDFSASYDLLSPATGPAGTEPYWLTYLDAPGGGYIGVVSFGGPDLDDASQIHVFYNYDTDPGAHTSADFWGDSLSQLDSSLYASGVTFGSLTVYESGVEIGDWDNGALTIPATADIGSITVSNSVPDAAATLPLLGLGLGALAGLRRRLGRA